MFYFITGSKDRKRRNDYIKERITPSLRQHMFPIIANKKIYIIFFVNFTYYILKLKEPTVEIINS